MNEDGSPLPPPPPPPRMFPPPPLPPRPPGAPFGRGTLDDRVVRVGWQADCYRGKKREKVDRFLASTVAFFFLLLFFYCASLQEEEEEEVLAAV